MMITMTRVMMRMVRRMRMMKMNIIMMTRMNPSTLTLSNELDGGESYENYDDNRSKISLSCISIPGD